MSKQAGTLITTYNANYIPPRFMPGYKGHCPTLKYDYGETYGNATAKHFQDYRSTTLNTSQSPYAKGGYFPTYYTHQPDLVIGNRTRTRDRWLHTPTYSLSNVHHDRKTELQRFDRLAQSHRENYLDKSSSVKRVDYFVLPTKAEDQFKKYHPFMVMSTKYIDDINLPSHDHIARRLPLTKKSLPKSSVRDREMRDVYFESR